MKTCPYCLGEIPDEAIKCMHCAEHLTTHGRRRAEYEWTPGRVVLALLALGMIGLAAWCVVAP